MKIANVVKFRKITNPVTKSNLPSSEIKSVFITITKLLPFKQKFIPVNLFFSLKITVYLAQII